MTWKADLIEEAKAFVAIRHEQLAELKSSHPARKDFARALGNTFFYEIQSHVRNLSPAKLASIVMSKPDPSEMESEHTTVQDVDSGLDCINIAASGKTIMYLMATLLIMAEVTDQLFQVAKISLRAAA